MLNCFYFSFASIRLSCTTNGSKQFKKANKMADNREDDELSIPRAALNKMIKEIIPNVRVANDARELVLNCCTEFIHLVSSEANDICNKQMKKTISPEHVLAGRLLQCYLSQLTRLWYLSHRRPAMAQARAFVVCKQSMEVDKGSDQKSDI